MQAKKEERTITTRFAAQVACRPAAPAVVFGDVVVSYGELARRARALAERLRALGVGLESLVGLSLVRSVDLIVALVGIVQAGGVYVPVDARLPGRRRHQLLQQGGVRYLVTTEALRQRFAAETVAVVSMDGGAARRGEAVTGVSVRPTNGVYVNYTSGSTGTPKGVLVPHEAVVRLVDAPNYVRLDGGTRLLQMAPIDFDAATLEVWGALLNGGTVVVMPPGRVTPEELGAAVARHGVDTLWLTSALLHQVVELALPALGGVRQLLAGGDVVAPADVDRVRQAHPRCQVINGYGPTENTTFSCCYPVPAEAKLSHGVPIGGPVSGTQVYVMDARLSPVPVGVTGELHVAGRGLARGYLGAPGATALRFVADPYGSAGTRMYRTGDLARWRVDGTLEFLGRADQQVKVRGFRVELGEVETALRAHPQVAAAAVALHGEGADKRLVGYVVRRESAADRATARAVQLTDWEQLYEATYRGAATQGDSNFVGWESSYTGMPIPVAEMRAWVAETVARVRGLGARRVLELGCGTGLVLTRVAPTCVRYVGVDFSREVVGQLERYRQERADLAHVELRVGRADELEFLADDSVDLVVLNSVIQYFPDVEYLLTVLRAAVRVTAPGGHVFVGDVRNLGLLEAYHASVQLHKAAEEQAVEELRSQVQRACRQEEELAVAPELFREMGRRWPKVERVTTWLKGAGYDNELSRFRYDLVLRVGGRKEKAVQPATWVGWDGAGGWRTTVKAALEAAPAEPVGLRGVRDGCVGESVMAARLLRDGAVATVPALAAACEAAAGDDLQAVLAFAGAWGAVDCSPVDATGRCDVVFRAQWVAASGVGEARADLDVGPYRAHTNVPARADSGAWERTVRTAVSERLPDYMVPAQLVRLAALPLTANGKVDRRALPAPGAPTSAARWRSPRTPEEEILCGLFGEVLGVARVGLDDDFFALGGHSLMAVSLVSRIRDVLGIDVDLNVLFDSSSVGDLAPRLWEGVKGRPSLVVHARPTPLPASYAQQRLWFLDQLEGTSTEYNGALALRLRGEVDVAGLTRAVNAVVARHESLRTHFSEVEGEPVQVVEARREVPVAVEDLRGAGETAVAAAIRREVSAPFDLSTGPVLRVRLLRVGDAAHVLLCTTHHIASDGWSQGVFNRELGEAYEAAVAGRALRLAPLAVQYADFTLWQRAWLEAGALTEGLAYWTEQLAGVPERLALPTDRPRPPVQTFEAEEYRMTLPASTTSALRRVSQESQATLYMTLLAGFGVVLARHSGQEDIVVGSPVANRQDLHLEGLIGFFVNSLVLRLRVEPTLSFRGLLASVRQTALAAYQHQDVPFERLVEALAPPRSVNTPPVFQVSFAVQNAPREALRLSGLTVEPVAGAPRTVRFDLEVHVWEHDGALGIIWLYNRALFDAWRVAQLAQHYGRVLAAVSASPEQAVGEVALLTAAERAQVLERWQGPAAEGAPLVLEQLEAQAARTPARVAVECGTESLTYGALNAWASEVARTLRARGAGPERVVGVAVERSVELVVALVGVLKAGAAYLPLDMGYPAARLRAMVSEAGPVCVLTSAGSGSAVLAGVPQVAVGRPRRARSGGRGVAVSAAMSAYVMYTSGSTGRPKGITVEHGALGTFLEGIGGTARFGAGDRHLAVTTVAFDISILELLGPLCVGATVLVARGEEVLDVGRLAGLVRLWGVTSLQATPSYWGALVKEVAAGSWRGLRLLSGGEALGTSVGMALRGTGGEVTNLYGPTEATIWCCGHRLTAADATAGAVVSLGRPLGGYRVYVLDAGLELALVGVTGELYVAGAVLARGYVQQAGATALRFVADPYGSAGTRMYRTGDLARWRVDGTLEFLGRADQQVKVRGFRIELGEIEAALRAAAGVSEAVVVGQSTAAGETQLVGYVVPVAGEVSLEQVRTAVSERLPDYMVPAQLVRLAALPLTANGKVDRRALPAPGAPTSAARWRSPRTPEEEILCGLFGEVLGVARVGLDDDFFALGGHSLMATRLVSRIRATLEVGLSVRTLFEAPTVGELSARLCEGVAPRAALAAHRRPTPLPASYAQQRLWFLDQLEGTSTEYNGALALRLRGEVDVAGLTRAVNAVVARHESLRTHFSEVEGEPVQVVEARREVPVAVEDLRGAGETAVAAAIRREVSAPFDLSTGPVLRVRLLRVGDAAHVLLCTTHHIASDGWSQGVFNRELGEAYEAAVAGRALRLAPLAVQYADFTLWQRAWLEAGALTEGLAYWTEQLAGVPERLALPTDRPRPPVQTFEAEEYRMTLPASTTSALRRVSQESQATLYMTLLAGFGVVLARHSGQEDIVVGSPVANRQDLHLEGLIGFFVNSLVLRLRVEPTLSFRGLLASVRQTALAAYQHQDVPFERLVEALAPPRSVNTPPVFQVSFAVQNAPREALRLSGLTVEPVAGAPRTVRFDLEVHVWEEGDALEVAWLYNRALFDAWRVAQLAQHYGRVLAAVSASPEQAVGEVALLTAAERAQVLERWQGPAAEGAPLVLEQLEAQAARTPARVAVECGTESLTYGALNGRANQLARVLRARGAGPERVVGVAVERSVELVVALVGVLKTGAAYLPLDMTLPTARLRRMVAETVPTCVLTTQALAAQVPVPAPYVLDAAPTLADLCRQEVRNLTDAERLTPLRPQHPIYILYTSGSTGVPKGVLNIQQSLVNHLLWMKAVYRINETDRVLQKTPHSFDVSVWELILPLISGGRLVMLPPGQHGDPVCLAETIVAQHVTTVHFVPSMLRAFLDDPVSARPLGLRRVLCGGEALPGALQQRCLQRLGGVQLHNLYGPTETTIDVTAWTCGVSDGAAQPPIGRPIWNTRVYVLDAGLELALVGVTGELYVAGAGVARGYVGQPGATASRFVADPYGGAGTRMYRTGDLGRWRADGTLEFLGRVDQQVKVRGFRIELEEIESTLRGAPGVAEAAVVVREDQPQQRRLVGYVLPIEQATLDGQGLRERVSATLPDYMVPAVIVLLQAWPLNANGKLDRNALPTPGTSSSSPSREPNTPQEQLMCRLFADVLRTKDVRVTDNFFGLGGDSIVSIQLVRRARAAGLTIAPRDVFQYQTVEGLAAAAGVQRPPRIERGEAEGTTLLTPIMCELKERHGTIQRFSQSVLIQVPQDLTQSELAGAITGVIEHHDALRLALRRSDAGTWTLEILPPRDVLRCSEPIVRVKVAEVDATTRPRIMTEAARAAEARLDPDAGVMVQAVWFDRGTQAAGSLLLIIHHLVVDGVSWRLIVSDLKRAHQDIRAGRRPDLGPKGTSFRQWAGKLWDEAHSHECVMELNYWNDVLRHPPRVAAGTLSRELDTHGTAQHLIRKLSSNTTKMLIVDVPNTCKCTIKEVLLTGLTSALAKWRRNQPVATLQTAVLIDVEGHGREEIFDDVDLSRTVGWFTCWSPARLDIGGLDVTDTETGWNEILRALRTIKEQLASVPLHGLRYGMLRYLNEETGRQLEPLGIPQVGFNYLGRYQTGGSETWSLAEEPWTFGSAVDADLPLAHGITVNAVTVDTPAGPQLRADWSWASTLFTKEDIQALSGGWFEALKALAEHTSDASPNRLSTDDIEFVELTQAELDRIQEGPDDLAKKRE